jgi:hypothetical protein
MVTTGEPLLYVEHRARNALYAPVALVNAPAAVAVDASVPELDGVMLKAT